MRHRDTASAQLPLPLEGRVAAGRGGLAVPPADYVRPIYERTTELFERLARDGAVVDAPVDAVCLLLFGQ
jgi:hypothetical protein